ncbi:uncharacterized protein BX664DRAFT_343212 [Halteromyces radiatus]|uniref:uncharacterized protein n=1 Tax=Halteromyces radiatus TaxID=101107 RepID=UPI00221EE0B4|nr:uncharacterized protein BX664DRAFT_343212 [Halteromyces radiatus]KAI8077682.1 hypothetical protein BX664DRAFT_343212 [Halteromyces radiatus]
MKKIVPKHGSVFTITLDEYKYYFRGDCIKGRIVLIPTRSYKVSGIKLDFFGRIRTYISSKKQDDHYYFKETMLLDVCPGTVKEGQTYTYSFQVNLPVDSTLPSCTESDTNIGGIIEYIITATIERPSRDWSPITTSIHIPVLERLDISKSDLIEPIWNRVSWHAENSEDMIDQDDYHGYDQTTVSASIPHKGYTRDQVIPITVDIQHFQPYQRANGLTVSLIRCTRILCKEKAYLLSSTVVTSTKLDIDIQRTSGQTITTSLLIPKYISPTITLNARLMQVDYRIEVRAEMDGEDTINDLSTYLMDKRRTCTNLASMRVELPIVIGTLPMKLSTLPPDILDPKFVKGVKHIGQENQSMQQQQQQQQQPKQQPSVLSSLASMDLLFSLPSNVLEISSTSFRWDISSSFKRASNIISQKSHPYQEPNSIPAYQQQHSHQSKVSSLLSVNEKQQYSTSETSKSSHSISSSSANVTQTTSPSFYLPLSLGEPFDHSIGLDDTVSWFDQMTNKMSLSSSSTTITTPSLSVPLSPTLQTSFSPSTPTPSPMTSTNDDEKNETSLLTETPLPSTFDNLMPRYSNETLLSERPTASTNLSIASDITVKNVTFDKDETKTTTTDQDEIDQSRQAEGSIKDISNHQESVDTKPTNNNNNNNNNNNDDNEEKKGYSPISGSYRLLTTFSNYRQPLVEEEDDQQQYAGKSDGKGSVDGMTSVYKPESTIEALDVSAAHIGSKQRNNQHYQDNGPLEQDIYDKPHEMSDIEDSDSDENDFLSLLARRGKQEESGYWQ